jgi:diaminopimelate epimerase
LSPEHSPAIVAGVPLPFYKYQSLGNDFIVVDAVADGPRVTRLGAPEAARKLCDRHFGIGADGILFLDGEVAATEASRRLTIWNADGSQAEMCGNGVRCVAKYLHDRLPVGERPLALVIATAAGPRRCAIARGPDGLAATVEVDMGRAEVGPPEAPLLFDDDTAEPGPHELVRVSMGNPHAILFRQDASPTLARRLGPPIERHPRFPRGTNVELARLEPDGSLTVHVWERGAGLTLACGTGACAAVAAACHAGLRAFGRPHRVVLPGGALTVRIDEGGGTVMHGPATHVFDGTLAESPC